MVFIRYGNGVAAYDGAWRSSNPGLAEMLNAVRPPDRIGPGEDPELAIARNALVLLRAGEIIDVKAQGSGLRTQAAPWPAPHRKVQPPLHEQSRA